MKTVTYLGHEFNVPTWAKFIAADSTGVVYAYQKAPVWCTKWGQYKASSTSMIEGVGKLPFVQPPLQQI